VAGTGTKRPCLSVAALLSYEAISHTMNKWQIICPLAFLAVVVVVGFVAVHEQGIRNRRALTSAVTRQLEGHSLAIVGLLRTMRTNETSEIEDAVFSELQRVPSTSLITRSDIRVTRIGDDHFRCVVDMTRWGLPPRTIPEPIQ